MAKFTTLWGDMEVGNITPAPETKNEDTQEDDEIQKPPVNTDQSSNSPKPDEDDSGADHEDDNDAGETKVTVEKPADKPKEKTTEQQEPVEFTEEDVNKAYTMLMDEGVLELDDDFEAEASTAGLADAVAATVRKKLQKEISSIPPVVQQFYNHVMEGNDPTEFKPQVETDWSEVIQTEKDSQRAAYYQFLRNQNISEEDAQFEVKDAEDRDLLDKKAKIAFDALIKSQEARKTAKQKAEQEKAKEIEEKNKQEIAKLNKTIDSMEEFAGFKMDDKRKQSFKDYLFKPNPRTGKTQMQMNMGDEERRLRLAFLDFVDFNRDDLKKEVQTEVTNTRKKKLARYTDKSAANQNSSRIVKQKEQNQGRGRINFPTIFGSQVIEVED